MEKEQIMEINESILLEFNHYLIEEEKSVNTIGEQLGNELPSIRKLAEASSTLGASMTPLLLNTATFY